MCGRYSLVIKVEDIQNQFSPDIQVPDQLGNNYNLAPTQQGAVITNQDTDQISLFQWGLIPFWAKEAKIGARMINARAEGIESKPSFRSAIRKRRCLVLADSFYEWKKEGKEKTPYRIFDPEHPLLVMAGIWEYWKQNEEEKHTYSIITTEPNKEMEPIHNRMPVIFTQPAQWEQWLADQEVEDILPMLRTPDDGILQMYPVPKIVGNVRNNGPELHDRVEA